MPADIRREAGRVAAIKRAYLQMDVKKLWHIKTMPAAENEDSGQFTSALISSMRRTMRNILELADADGQQTFECSTWVDGWQTPLHKALHRSINRRDPDVAASLMQILDSFFHALDKDSASGTGGQDLFAGLERRLISYFDKSDQAGAIKRLSSFSVATDVPFADYLREFKLLISSVSGTGRQTGPSDAMCQTYVRNSIAQQFPTLMPSLFPGVLAQQEVPYTSIDAMWSAFATQENNLTPAIRGTPCSSVSSSSLRSASAHASGSRGRSHSSSNSTWTPNSVGGSVMPVQNQKDPFRASFDAWPFSKETWDDVYVVSTTAFGTNDPHLWTPLLSPSARKDAFRRHANTCINCGGTGHNMRDCPEPCINTFSLMNPDLQNNTPAWRR